MSFYSSAVFLTLEQTTALGFSFRSGVGPRIYVSNNFPGDADAAFLQRTNVLVKITP